MRGLTSLFGMGRGEHPRQNHHKSINPGYRALDNKVILGKVVNENNGIDNYKIIENKKN
jgi:hypothetical protein